MDVLTLALAKNSASSIPGQKGDTGNGIKSTTINNDYTLTIKFTDGTSYTTPSIRGEKGETGSKGAKGDKGDTGAQGIQGIQGEKGDKGETGDSAYEIAKKNGFVSTEEEWLESLKVDESTVKSIVDKVVGDSVNEISENISKLSGDIATAGAGAHNSIYRGKNLGTSVTAAQYAAIKAGTFDDMYIGDYWVINSTTYRIAAFDYYYRTGDTSCDTHHVTLVPDGNMYTHCMNDTNITTGAYVGSKMYTEGLNQAKETINTAFDSAHILNHRQYLQNAVTDAYASGGSWYDSTVELMTEQNVYGGKMFGNCKNGTAMPSNHTVDKSQYPLFAFRPDMISNRQWFWLRDIVSAAGFADVDAYGYANYNVASYAGGVRPAFSIIG